MRFTKMQGLGNDYVYIDCTQQVPEDLPALAVRLADRHYGAGGDGLICICPSEQADFKMRMFNADGSEGEMCGNGVRCVAKYVYDKGLTEKTELEIETLAGVKQLRLQVIGGQASLITVDMGQPLDIVEDCQISVSKQSYHITKVSMGNPHAVLFVEDVARLDLQAIGPGFECHPSFPNRTNTEFVQVLDRERLQMRVWERGSGETLACGTGACAALVAAVINRLCEPAAAVQLPGGILQIEWNKTDNHIYMTGPAVTVFEGEWPE